MFRPHEYAWKNAIFCKPSPEWNRLWQRTFEDGENAKIPKICWSFDLPVSRFKACIVNNSVGCLVDRQNDPKTIFQNFWKPILPTGLVNPAESMDVKMSMDDEWTF